MTADYPALLAADRKARRMTQEQYADYLNKKLNRKYDRNRVNKMENGREPVPANVRLLLHQRPASDGVRTLVVAVALQKGGVGKTTTAVNVGYALAASGHPTLLVDMDAQSHTTIHLGQDPVVLAHENRTIYHAMLKGVPIEDVIVKAPLDVPLYCAPTSLVLANAEVDLQHEVGREYILNKTLKPIRDQFRFIIIDCAPGLGQVTHNALTAANVVLVPTETAAFSLLGIPQLLNTINTIRDTVNPNLSVFGIVPTKYDGRTAQNRASLDELQQTYGHTYRIFPAISHSTTFPESAAAGVPALVLAPETKSMEVYAEIANALIEYAERGF